MPASTLLVTVRGSFKTINLELPGIDLELPGDVPVGELIPLLLEICGPQEYDVKKALQAPISLKVEGTRIPLSLESTLVDADVCDGTVLVLQTNHSLSAPNRKTCASQLALQSESVGAWEVSWLPSCQDHR